MTRLVLLSHYLRPTCLQPIAYRFRTSTNNPHASRCKRVCHGALLQRSYSESTQAANGPRLQIKLRQYQEECIVSVLSHLEQGHKRLGISLATGSGKTVVFTHLINRVPPRPANSRDQTLILVHRRELVEQAVRHCIAAYPDKRVEVEMGKEHASGYADITIASVASITSNDRLLKFDPACFKLVLVDEAHHIVARTYLKVLEHFKLAGAGAPAQEGPALVGVSATLSRFDGVRLGAALDHIVYHKDYVDMIGEKWLSDVKFTTIKSHVDLSKVKASPYGDFALDALSKAVNTDQVNGVTVRSWLAKAGQRKSTLVFCVDTAHVRSLTEKFRSFGIEAHYITGKDRVADRTRKLDEFRAGRYPVLLNCGVFTEGTDIPNIDCVLLARPTRSRNMLVQMIGRGMRLHPDKENCHVIDMVASLETGVLTVPTLFGLDPSELVNDASVDTMRQLQQKQQLESESVPAKGAPVSKVTFTDYDSVHDLLNDDRKDKHVRALSQFAWVEVDDNKYVLGNRHGGHVSIEAITDDGHGNISVNHIADLEREQAKMMYIIRYNEKVSDHLTTGNKWRAFKRTREIGRSPTFEGAVRAADTYVEKNQYFERYFVTRNARWRTMEPSQEQLNYLNSMRDDDHQLDGHSINKGQATDMIAKIKHGARGRFHRVKTAQKRGAAQARQHSKQRREYVQVGPVDAL